MTDTSITKIEKLSSCLVAMEKASDDVKEIVINELNKLKDEIRSEREKRMKKT